jgi:hypothetical protein
VAGPVHLQYVLTQAQQELAQWLLHQEGAHAHESADPVGPTQQVLRRLSPGVTALVTAEGYRALLARALHLTKTRFPFLEGVQLSNADTFIEAPGLAQENPIEVSLAEFIGHLIALLATFIGDDLTNNLIRGAWPDAPLQRSEPRSGGKP